MLKQTVKTHHCLSIGVVILIFAAAMSLSGCKETTSQPAPNEPADSNNVQTPSQAPAKAGNPTAADAAKPHVVASAEQKKSLVDVIRNARTWGPAYESWYGKTAPDFALKDLAGREHKLSDYRGKKVMLVFWATWCPPCKMEIPDLVKLRNDLAEDKLTMLAISAEKADLLTRFVEQKINYTVLVDTGNMPAPFGFMRIYETSGVPCSFFIDSEGNIILATSGLISLSDLKAIIEAI